MFNPAKIFKIKGAWESFARNHPKFVNFIGALKNNYIKEGTIIEISVSTEDGKQITSNLKLTEEDIKLFTEMSELFKS
ncbi:hypothetical protein [Herbinix luporum]|jgi:hypothetical protein|uniref:Uncharacterized protein n=1 Tax=Herbinix luporum TaxID=1679721 RepID=A0A0K8J470_9FIRM|nr:hypothetical protein [Herbinix luporum]CUH92123.1 hypothetical protein SD1D_0571 [Herbinix luporum]HHT57494.1 hypothetical protein [Herbinix luporum]